MEYDYKTMIIDLLQYAHDEKLLRRIWRLLEHEVVRPLKDGELDA